jgi:DNA-binding transcriptional LysR family regulator
MVTFDLGFSLSPPDHPDIHVKEVMTDEVVLVMSKKHPLAKKTKLEVICVLFYSLQPLNAMRSRRPFMEQISHLNQGSKQFSMLQRQRTQS